MKVDVYADFACAWSRLGIYRFARAVAEAGGEPVELVHRPYQLDPEAPEQPRPLVEMMAEMFGDRRQAVQALGEMTELAAGEGVEYRFDDTLEVNTLTAHRLMWFAEQQGLDAPARERLARAVYDAHFVDGVNIADHTELARLAEETGLDGARVKSFLASDEGTAEVREQVEKAKGDGIASVPTFVFEGGEVLRGASTSDEILAVLQRARA